MAITLMRVLHAEMLKLKGTIALKIVVLFPVIVALLEFFAVSQAPFSSVNRDGIHYEWAALTLGILRPWGLLMMPLFIALECALVAGLDHSGNQWKSLLARPLPRWTPYVAKLIVVVSMVAASTIVLLCGILFDGAILPHVQPQVVFGFPVPWATMCRQAAQIFGLSFLALAVQHWVSLRWQSFSVAISVGIVGTVLGVAIAGGADQVENGALYFPWALPTLVVGRPPHNVEAGLLIGGALGLVATLVGCLEFCKREVV
jgi:lantibiotic transport system permease protein